MIFAAIELPVLIVYIVMAIGFVALIWGVKNLNTKANGRIIMIVGAVLVLGAVAASFMVSGTKSEDARMMKNIKVFQMAKAEKAASYIADRFPGGTAAFLISESASQVPTEEFLDSYVLEELQSRLSDKGVTPGEVLIVGRSKEVVDKSGQSSTVVEDPTNPKIMKSTLDTVYDKVDIVVNFVGLPNSLSDLRTITFLTRKNTATGKNNMLLMTDLGFPYVEQDMIKNGRVSAIIDYIGESDELFDMHKENAPKDLEDAFDYQYMLIDKDSISSFVSDNPKYFVSK